MESADGPLDGRDGVAVLMRYTLRLLTAQQFQRATALVCAAELARLADEADLGQSSRSASGCGWAPTSAPNVSRKPTSSCGRRTSSVRTG